jgi:hypothetical protein
MMPMGWFLRMFMWVRNPPSRNMRRVIAVVGVTAIVLVAWEYFFGWPEALTVNRIPRGF